MDGLVRNAPDRVEAAASRSQVLRAVYPASMQLVESLECITNLIRLGKTDAKMADLGRPPHV